MSNIYIFMNIYDKGVLLLFCIKEQKKEGKKKEIE